MGKKAGVVMAKRQKIDWENIPITVIDEGSKNPQNPFSQLSSEERTANLKELCQNIYLRMSEKSGSGDNKK